MQTQAATPSTDKATPSYPDREIPRRKETFLIGSTLDFQKDQVDFVEKIHEENGDVVKARIVNEDWIFLRDPEMIHEINVRRWEEFQKPPLAKRLWEQFLGNGLVPNDGPHWKRQHDMIKPGFHRQRIDAYGPHMVAASQQMITRFQEGSQRDIRQDINNLALSIVGKTLFDAPLEDASDVVFKGMHDVSETLVEYINMPIPAPKWWPSKTNRRKVAAIESIEQIIRTLIAERKADGRDRGDLLSTLAFAKDTTGAGMTDKEMRDEAMTLIFAGHETSAHAMTWLWYLLAKHPDKAQKLYEEVRSVAGDRAITVDDLDKMPYSLACMKEGLRLRPSVWTYMRAATQDLRIKGYLFKKHQPIFISPYLLGRDARIHPEPLKFEPERWTREYERNLPKGAWVPFAAGPRVCLGQGFAQMEMRLVIATMIQNLVPVLKPGFEPAVVPELSMHPGPGGLQCMVQFREDAPLRPAAA